MTNTLSWLDSSVPDDRIIASVLALQADRPGAAVVLVSSDINLLNKADAALVESAETPAS
jgi:predicted ribonuclease YlaK